MGPKLKPCPFCGPDGTPRFTPVCQDTPDSCSVRCWSCGAGRKAIRTTDDKARRFLVRWWNKRSMEATK